MWDRNFRMGGEIHRFRSLLATLRGEKINAVQTWFMTRAWLRREVKNERLCTNAQKNESFMPRSLCTPDVCLPRNYTFVRLIIASANLSIPFSPTWFGRREELFGKFSNNNSRFLYWVESKKKRIWCSFFYDGKKKINEIILRQFSVINRIVKKSFSYSLQYIVYDAMNVLKRNNRRINAQRFVLNFVSHC